MKSPPDKVVRPGEGNMMDDNPVPTRHVEGPNPTRWTAVVGLAAVTSTLLLVSLLSVPSRAYAAEAPVALGTAGTYSVLGGQTVTNTGPSALSGNLGVSPGTAITGFPPGTVGGATHAGDAQAAQAQSDLVIAYNDAAGRAATAIVAGDLVGQTLTAGVYKSTSSLALSGTLTLDGQGNPNAVFIFQMASTLTTASASNVNLINGAQASNVFWQVGSSASLGTTSSFTGTIMALTSITVTTGTVVKGRALAHNGAVTLDNNTFTTVVSGALSITVPAGPVNLGSVIITVSSQTVSAQLGVVTVTDNRGGTAGWTATAGATDFVGPQTISVSTPGSSSYLTPPAAVTGTATVAPSNLSPLNPSGPVQVATGVNGINTATWNPTISVTIPATVMVGTYSTTITHSVT